MSQSILRRVILIFVVLQLAGCATDYGRRHRAPAVIRFTADIPKVSFYLISPEENELLFKGGVSPLAKDEYVQAELSKKRAYPADGFRTAFTQADVVVLYDCGREVRRVRLFLKGNIAETLICK